MTEEEFTEKKSMYEVMIRAETRAGKYAAIKNYIRNPGTGPVLSTGQLQKIARGRK